MNENKKRILEKILKDKKMLIEVKQRYKKKYKTVKEYNESASKSKK